MRDWSIVGELILAKIVFLEKWKTEQILNAGNALVERERLMIL